MYFVIVGAGKISFALIQLLLDHDHEVVLVEKDIERCQQIADDFDIIAISDDATKEKVLEQANVKGCDALIALTDSDEVNLIVGMMAKEKGAKKVAVRLAKTTYDKTILTKMGIDLSIHPEVAAAMYIEEILLKPVLIDLAFLSTGEAELEEILVTKSSEYYGKKIKQINTDDERIIAVYEGKKLKYPKDDCVLKENDKILVLVNRSQEEE
ncbi:MAG: hypothetical protein COT14_03050 [Candidatus Diapherotrites archaeon CG08_land_8_20_14_0_20_30_16]|nr:MAG: hypothetical protein COT14_03050 [Candidatus Diapherotrites archaeon CG08_land_8_20_14_0_20_30_16]